MRMNPIRALQTGLRDVSAGFIDWLLRHEFIRIDPVFRIIVTLLEWTGQWRLAWDLDFQRNMGKTSDMLTFSQVCLVVSRV